MSITREKFITKLIRAGLFVLLAVIIYALGNKVVPGKNCSKCPVNGICKGENDCSKY